MSDEVIVIGTIKAGEVITPELLKRKIDEYWARQEEEFKDITISIGVVEDE